MTGLHPFEKAAIRRDWASDNLSAQIHSVTGENAALLVNKAGRIFFVVLGAAMALGIAEEDVEIRILRGAVNALHDQAGEAVIEEGRRASIASGLDAADRLTERLTPEAIFRAACHMNLQMRTECGIGREGFEALRSRNRSRETTAC